MNFGKYKLKVKDEKYDVIVVTKIPTDIKVVWVDEVKGKLKILISDKLLKDIKEFRGFEILRPKDEKRLIKLVGTDIQLDIVKATRLNIDKKMFFIEEIEECKFRLTYSTGFVKDISKINEMLLE